MSGNGAETALAEASPVRGERLADGLKCADLAGFVVGVSIAFEIKGVDRIKFFGGKRWRGRIMDQEAISMLLDKSGGRVVDVSGEQLEHAKEFAACSALTASNEGNAV